MKIGIVGATGVVGRMMIDLLDELAIPVEDLRLFASKKSAGKCIGFHNKEIKIEETTEQKMKENFDCLLFSAGSTVSKKFAPIAADAGNTIIDNSSAFRRQKNIPLIVPEINGNLLQNYHGIIANPNCSTIQMVLALYPIHLKNPIKKIIVSTYQAVSGAGQNGILELENQESGSTERKQFEHHIHRNVIPKIGDFAENGYSQEEEKMKLETQKIMQDLSLKIVATAVRVPVLYGHSESIYIECENPMKLQTIKSIWKQAESVTYHEEWQTPLDLKDSNLSHCSRLRFGTDNTAMTFWNTAHNVRVGAATNAVRILKKIKG